MIINDLDGYYIVFDTKNWNTELDTLIIVLFWLVVWMEEVSATLYPFKKRKYQTWICCSYVQMDSIKPRIA